MQALLIGWYTLLSLGIVYHVYECQTDSQIGEHGFQTCPVKVKLQSMHFIFVFDHLKIVPKGKTMICLNHQKYIAASVVHILLLIFF